MDEHQHVTETCAPRAVGQPPEIGELIDSKLRRSGYSALHRLSCDFRDGVVTLRGCLPSYYLKQIALAMVAKVEGVERIDDQIEVAPNTTTTASSGRQPARRP